MDDFVHPNPVHRFVNNYANRAGCGFECADEKNASVAGSAEAFLSVQSDSQTSDWYSYFENDVLVYCIIQFIKIHQNIAEEEVCAVKKIEDS